MDLKSSFDKGSFSILKANREGKIKINNRIWLLLFFLYFCVAPF